MEYKPCKFKDEFRTGDYIGTVTSKNDPSLLAIKADMRARNKNAREWLRRNYEYTGKMSNAVRIERIQLMARGPRTKPAREDGLWDRSYDQSLPHRHATHFDVYRRPDTNAEYHMRAMLEMNATPGEYAKLRKLEYMMWDNNLKIYDAARKMGLNIAFDRAKNITLRK